MAILHLKVIGFCVFAALGGALFGYDIGVISSCFTMPDFIERFGEQNSDGTHYLSPDRQSIITSLLGAGTFVGSIVQSFTADLKWGRKGSIFFWSLVFSIGAVIQVSSSSGIAQLTVGRFIAGLGVGALSALIPLYNGEAAPKHLRGALVVLYQVMITLGIMWAYGLDWITHQIPNAASWRIPVGFQLIFGGVLCGGVLFLPESPRHLLNYNNPEGAAKSIARMNNVDPSDPIVIETLRELETMLALENEGGKASWFELLRTNHQMWKRTLNACTIQFVQQLNGQNFYYYYGPAFFRQSGTGLNTYQIQFILGVVTFVATIPALWLIERLGRRKMLFIGSAGEIVCALIAAFAGHFMLAGDEVPESEFTARNITGGQLLVAFAIIQIFFFGCFWGPVPWVISAEMFPLRVRAKGIAVSTATNWLWNFLLGFFSPRIANDIGPLILLIFTGVLTFGFVYIYFMLPETRGLSLEEIDELHALHVKPWRSSSWTPPSRANNIGEVNEKGEVVHRERKPQLPMMMH